MSFPDSSLRMREIGRLGFALPVEKSAGHQIGRNCSMDSNGKLKLIATLETTEISGKAEFNTCPVDRDDDKMYLVDF